MFKNNVLIPIIPTHITATLRLEVIYLDAQLGFLPSDISARYLHATGSNDFLCASIDTDITCLLGRWRSDEMLRYLYIQAGPVMQDFSHRILEVGNFTLIPNKDAPTF